MEVNTGEEMIKLLITGCEGLLGQNLLMYANWDHFDITGIDLPPKTNQTQYDSFHYHSLDLTDHERLYKQVVEIHPDVILNAAAMTAVDRCETEPETCYRINRDVVVTLAEAAQSIHARLIQISTDYVFDGTEGPYEEGAPVHPLSVYGTSKLGAEEAVLAMPEGLGTIVRTVVLYGHGKNLTSSFVTWLIESLRKGEPVRIVDDQVSNVTLASEMATILLEMAEKGCSGVYHVSSRDRASRYQFALDIAEVYGFDKDLISPVSTAEFKQPAPRPMNGGLSVDKVEAFLGRKVSTIHETILHYRDEAVHWE